MIKGLITIGLTGQSGAGKTTATKAFEKNGFSVIDCDMLSREVVKKDSLCLKEIASEFGDVLLSNGELDRKKLGDIVFNDAQKLNTLDNIIYPYITCLMIKKAGEIAINGGSAIILDAPTLFEAGLDMYCDAIVAITAPEQVRIDRIIKRDNITKEQAISRIRSQHDDAFFNEHCRYVLSNDANEEELFAKIMVVCLEILKEYFDEWQ